MYFLLLLSLVCVYVDGKHVPGSGKIINGKPVDIKKFDYMVSFQLSGKHMCGGSIISPNWVLTAAHCIEQDEIPFYTFRAGSNHSAYGGQVVKVTTVKMHPKYNTIKPYNFDFALVKVTPNFKIGVPGINKATLSTYTPTAGTVVTVSGWGHTQNSGQNSPVLLATDVVIQDRITCNETYNGDITDVMICATAPGTDSCQNDSGGPLVVKDSKVQVGVVSFGNKCADPVYPGVYALPHGVQLWIYKETGVIYTNPFFK